MSDLDLHQIRREHGDTVYDGGRRWVGPGPCHSRRDASLSVRLGDDGRALVHSFAGDSFAACAAHLGLQWAEPERLDKVAWLRRKVEREADARRKASQDLAFCEGIWSGAIPIEGTPAETYLYGRGLLLEHCPVLRFHPTAPRSKRSPDGDQPPPPPPHAAMVAIVSDAAGQPRALHLTYLTPDGRKAFGDRSRLMFGGVAGGAVRLDPIGREGVLAVGEGIETSASFAMLKGVPTWAALSTSGLQTFAVPAGVRKLLVAVDSDDGGAGLKAAHALAERAQRQCDVELHPAPEGRDWNDEVAHG